MQPEELRALRKGTGMTGAEFAEALGMSRKSIVEMEAGRAPIEKRTELAARYVASDEWQVREAARRQGVELPEGRIVPYDAPAKGDSTTVTVKFDPKAVPLKIEY